MSYLLSHLPQSLLVAGILALIIEVAILGFASIVLFFLGLSLVLSGLLMLIGILPETLTAALWSNALITCGLALALWKPLKRLQDERQPTPINSDLPAMLLYWSRTSISAVRPSIVIPVLSGNSKASNRSLPEPPSRCYGRM